MKGEKIVGGMTIVERFLDPVVYEVGTPRESSPALYLAGKLVDSINSNDTLTNTRNAEFGRN